MQVNISPKALGPSAQRERPNTIECRRVVQISTRALRALSQGFDRNQAITFVFQMAGRIGPRDFSLVPKTPSKTRCAVFPQRASQSRFTFQAIHLCEELQHMAA